ncbi:MAG: efflux RND transporter periplasmic adaptor subunit [Thermodesulfobacteriota bacterium]
MKKRMILIVFLVLLILAGGLVYWGQYKRRSAENYYSGTIEATQADIAFQIRGKVKEILADEGERLTKDQLLAVLDPEELSASRNQTRATLIRSQETHQQLKTLLELNRKVLPSEVDRAQAAVRALEAQVLEAETGYRRQEVEQARLSMEAARLAMEDARKNKIRYDQLFLQKVVAEREKDSADLKFETALRQFERAQEAFNLAKEGFRSEAIESARARLEEGRAALKLARENLKKIDLTQKEVDAAAAQVEAAKAALDLSEIQLSYTRLTSPFEGIVTNRSIEVGEIVTPGQEVFSISDLSKVELKIYVDETEIGKVKPGQKARIRIDTFPLKSYTGHVSFISPEGEFTPKIIQTQKERVKLVYLVKITIPNPDLELKTGMPADAWLITQ